MTANPTNRRDILAATMAGGAAMLLAGASGPSAAQSPAAAARDPHPLGVNPLPPELTAPAQVARLAGVDLWYWDTGGSGAPIVLLHPATGSGLIWGYQQAALAAAGHRVIGYSRRGYWGSTSGDPANRGTGAEDMRMLLDHLGIKRAHLVATAAGAFIGASFALAWPERVRSLTLACTILSGADREVMALVPSLREPWWNGLPQEFRELSPSYRALNREGVALWHKLEERSRGDNTPFTQPTGEQGTLASIARFTMPVLLISGASDLISPPPVARAFAKAIPDSELVVLSECGHSAYWERPDLFNAAIIDFLKRRGG
jgi:pimeloyl-ACP methyl ester carboxylesterase